MLESIVTNLTSLNLETIKSFYESHSLAVNLYVIIHLATYFLFVHVFGKGHLKNYKDPQIKARGLEPFNRTDIENWSLIKCFPMIMTFWPRFVGF